MARKPIISRTFKSQEVTLLCVNTALGECFNSTVIFPREEKNTDKLLRKCKNAVENDTVKVADIVNVDIKEELYGMEEETFLKYASKLDNTTRKPVENTAEEVAVQ